MEEHGEGADDEGHMPSLDSEEAELANSHLVARCSGYDGDIVLDPLFHQYSHKRCDETHGETREPQAVDPAVVVSYGEIGVWAERRRGDAVYRDVVCRGSQKSILLDEERCRDLRVIWLEVRGC